MKAVVKEIQVAGGKLFYNLYDACREYLRLADDEVEISKDKIHLTIQLPNGELAGITFRQEENEVVAYGDFSELPNALDYAKDVLEGHTFNDKLDDD